MKPEMTRKLILYIHKPEAMRQTDSTVYIRPDLFRRLDALRIQTGLSIRELAAILLQYALENTVIEEA